MAKEKIYSMPEEKSKPVHSIRLKDPLLEDLNYPGGTVTSVSISIDKLPEKGDRFRFDLGATPLSADVAKTILKLTAGRPGDKTAVLVTSQTPWNPGAVVAFRNALWPEYHVTRAYNVQNQKYVDRFSAEGTEKLTKHFVATWSGMAVSAVKRAAALAPDTTIAKFNKNAAGWSGDQKSPVYPHHRWMRRIVAELGNPKPGQRTLDAGCGAGWVGIEAAKKGAVVSAFDPSPEMVKFVLENAAAENVKIDAQTGFVEKSPWTEPFSLVLNSGVISFAPDADQYLDALDAMVEKGGTLVIGDLNPLSRGMQKRRATEPIVPIRELNASTRADVIRKLEKRGYNITARRYYQLTDPWNRYMYFCARNLGGIGCGYILNKNARAASVDSDDAAGFDSWLIRAEKR
ncbi:MAG: class I SAM-dependent methyltransferase [Planctomycetota bacterium]